MFFKSNLILPEKLTDYSARFGRLLLALILTSLVLSLIVSCGKNSDNPTGPGEAPLNEFEWTTALPEDHGFDPDLLDTLTYRISHWELGRLTSVLIVRSGYLVYEEYFRGNDSSDLVPIYSCTKSVASALMGIAIGEGKIGGVEDKLFDYLGGFGYTLFPSGGADSLRREQMSIENLLTMTAGFLWDEFSVPYGDPENSYNMMVATDNWLAYLLNQPVLYDPGTRFEYNTGLSGLMAVILQNSTGQRADHYARDKLFHKIGIDTCIWRFSPQGIPMTGSGLQLRPRDMAKFG